MTDISRRRVLQVSVAAPILAATVGCSRAKDAPVRPEGVPLGPYDKKTTSTQVLAGLDLNGRTMLITGATSGLGLESMRALHAAGASVIGTGRTLAKAREACASVGARCTPLELELESVDSIRACSDALRALGTPLDAVICNAGIMALPKLEQVNGIEKQFFVNHLGHFLLVNRVLPQVQAAQQGRVVVVSSSAYKWAPPEGIEFDNFSGARDYTPNKAYGISKTANGLFSLELARRFAGTNATSNSLSPGAADTNLWRHAPKWQQRLGNLIGGLLLKSVEAGAATQCHLAASPMLAKVSGQYFEDCNPLVPGGQMTNAALATRLWDASVELCGNALS
jgi:NAD(P)-dependent dehydrogenase (short-subunit alcohol dehydrogenase family)